MQKVNVYLELEKALIMLHMDWTEIEWSHLKTSGCCSSNNRKNEAKKYDRRYISRNKGNH